MREILFRGISKESRQHVFGDVFHDRERVVISWYDENGEYQEEEVLPYTIEQFTGVLDVDGKKIFEGDTVGREDIDENEVYSVYFYKGKYIISYCPYDTPNDIGSYFYDDLDGNFCILATDHIWG